MSTTTVTVTRTCRPAPIDMIGVLEDTFCVRSDGPKLYPGDRVSFRRRKGDARPNALVEVLDRRPTCIWMEHEDDYAVKWIKGRSLRAGDIGAVRRNLPRRKLKKCRLRFSGVFA